MAWLASIPWRDGFFFAGVIGVTGSVLIALLAFRTLGDDRPWMDGKDSSKGALCFVAFILLMAFFMGLFPSGE